MALPGRVAHRRAAAQLGNWGNWATGRRGRTVREMFGSSVAKWPRGSREARPRGQLSDDATGWTAALRDHARQSSGRWIFCLLERTQNQCAPGRAGTASLGSGLGGFGVAASAGPGYFEATRRSVLYRLARNPKRDRYERGPTSRCQANHAIRIMESSKYWYL